MTSRLNAASGRAATGAVLILRKAGMPDEAIEALGRLHSEKVLRGANGGCSGDAATVDQYLDECTDMLADPKASLDRLLGSPGE